MGSASEGEGPRAREFVIGIDLGTSATKAIVQDPASNDAWAVPLADLFGVQPRGYLLPTSIEINRSGGVSLGTTARAVRDLKLRLILPGDAQQSRGEPQVYLAAYLAMVLRKVRSWFEETKSGVIGSATPIWEVNVGMPAGRMDASDIRATYERVCRAAWRMSLCAGDLTLASVAKALTASGSGDESDTRLSTLSVLPEVVGQMIGYARSNLRRSGLHLLVDIGAGTLDALMFNLHELDGEDRFSILQADVVPLGAMVLHRWRISSLARLGLPLANRVGDGDDWVSVVPAAIDEYIASPDAIAPDVWRKVHSGEHEFEKRCFDAIQKVVRLTRERRYPSAPEWKPDRELTCFLAGGGSRCGLYRNVFESIRRNARGKGTNLTLRALPLPRRFDMSNSEALEFDRLSVAYGLSFTTLDLGAVHLPSEIADE